MPTITVDRTFQGVIIDKARRRVESRYTDYANERAIDGGDLYFFEAMPDPPIAPDGKPLPYPKNWIKMSLPQRRAMEVLLAMVQAGMESQE